MEALHPGGAAGDEVVEGQVVLRAGDDGPHLGLALPGDGDEAQRAALVEEEAGFEGERGAVREEAAVLVDVADHVLGEDAEDGDPGAIEAIVEVVQVGLVGPVAGHSIVGDAAARAHLIQNAKNLKEMSDPRLVPIYEVTSDLTHVSILMEFIRDPTLAAWQLERVQSFEDVMAVYIAAGKGLAALHKKGLLHRNFKPTNVFVERARSGRRSHVRIAGFGMQRDGTPYEGNPYYASPEHCDGRTLTDKSDQFSFCVALHHALFAEHPYLVPANNSIHMADCWDDPPNPKNAVVKFFVAALERALFFGHLIKPRNIPSDRLRIYKIITRGLEREPGKRHESMEKLLARLRAALLMRSLRARAIVLSLALPSVTATLLVLGPWNPAAPKCPEEVAGALKDIGQLPLTDQPTSTLRRAHCQARLKTLRATLAASGTPSPITVELVGNADQCLIHLREP